MPNTLTNCERLNFINQFEILNNLKSDPHYKICIEILKNGYTSEYKTVFQNLQSEVSDHISKEVCKILNMYRSLIFFANKKNKKLLSKIEFDGFDVATEYDYWSYANFLLNTLNRFTEFKQLDCDEDFNSHSSTLNGYRRQLRVWSEYNEPNAEKMNNEIALKILSA